MYVSIPQNEHHYSVLQAHTNLQKTIKGYTKQSVSQNWSVSDSLLIFTI